MLGYQREIHEEKMTEVLEMTMDEEGDEIVNRQHQIN